MNDTIDNRWRAPLLAVTGIGIGTLAILSFIVPTIGNKPVAPFTFPARLPLNSWQQNQYQPLARSLTPNNAETLVAAASYRYRDAKGWREQLAPEPRLEAEIRYIVETRGDVRGYITDYTDLTPQDVAKGEIAQIENIGYHYLFTSSDRAYLSSCISPRSPSSVTSKQFSQHRYLYDLQPQVWWNWLWGETSIRDRRCLWTHLSVAIEDAEVRTAYQTLETAWIDWYRWWQPRFPSL